MRLYDKIIKPEVLFRLDCFGLDVYWFRYVVALAMTEYRRVTVIARDVPTIRWVVNPEAIQLARYQ
ncbi:MAG: hypothetical protein FWE33_00270 [Defluviitaleaceae bacterium]|nr:hypothetical protein [Defluviitaleaceae bacterium]